MGIGDTSTWEYLELSLLIPDILLQTLNGGDRACGHLPPAHHQLRKALPGEAECCSLFAGAIRQREATTCPGFRDPALPPRRQSDRVRVPRVAYLCRFHAFERIHLMDPKSTGRGVRQLKTCLLQRLEQDDKLTIHLRKEESDARELKSFYDKKRSEKEDEIASVLQKVLKAVLSGAGCEFPADGEDVEEKSVSYEAHNILPIDSGDKQNAITLLPEIKAAISAVQHVRGLPLAENTGQMVRPCDLLNWLQSWFGFQAGNVANQREHLVLLLANLHVRQKPKPMQATKLDDRAVDELMEKILKTIGTGANFWDVNATFGYHQ
ncbi:hypothetical protein HPP92_008558 [Vanilla planifolia]|uniref:Uncharacterized protein n=1 Tax=Vanilla planifolia TaxID=51239 RepID=A0A835R9V9_VANPL|nr:hypothetical protein HPP92_008558 [Vanilla planifolia]